MTKPESQTTKPFTLWGIVDKMGDLMYASCVFASAQQTARDFEYLGYRLVKLSATIDGSQINEG